MSANSWIPLEGKKLYIEDGPARGSGRAVPIFEAVTRELNDLAPVIIVRPPNSPYSGVPRSVSVKEGVCRIEALCAASSQVWEQFVLLREVASYNCETRELTHFNPRACSTVAMLDRDITTVDSAPGWYYVTARNDSGRAAFLLGPYEQHIDALLMVSRASVHLRDKLPDAAWYAYGTARVAMEGVPPKARLNDEILTPQERELLVKDPEVGSDLPEMCFLFEEHAKPGAFIRGIRRGEMGYFGTTYTEQDPVKAKALVALMNSKLGVTDEQAERMHAGSMFGWDAPAATGQAPGRVSRFKLKG